MRALVVLSVLVFSFSAYAEKAIVLTESSIAGMSLSYEMPISLYKLWQEFPYHIVTHELGEGEPGEFHLFTVSERNGPTVAIFLSYIEEEAQFEAGVVPLHRVVVFSGGVKDQYGVSPGDSLASVLARRKGLEFGVAHMDNYLGKGKLWYQFTVQGKHGAQVSRTEAEQANPTIELISWPAPWSF